MCAMSCIRSTLTLPVLQSHEVSYTTQRIFRYFSLNNPLIASKSENPEKGPNSTTSSIAVLTSRSECHRSIEDKDRKFQEYSKSPHIGTYKNKNLEAVFPKLRTLQLRTCFSLMKNMLLWKGVAKLIFDCCY